MSSNLPVFSIFSPFLLIDCRVSDLPVSVLWQGAEGLCASLHGARGGRWIAGHTRRETAIHTHRKSETVSTQETGNQGRFL